VLDVVRRLSEQERDVVELVDHDLNVSSQPRDYRMTDDPEAVVLPFRSSDARVDPCSLLDCASAWDAVGYGSSEVVVGVVDSGCNLNERNFGGLEKFAGWALFDGGSLCTHETLAASLGPDVMLSTSTRHGTLSATLIAASADTYVVWVRRPIAGSCPCAGTNWQETEICAVVAPQSDRVSLRLRRRCLLFLEYGADSYWPDAISAAIQATGETGGATAKDRLGLLGRQ